MSDAANLVPPILAVCFDWGGTLMCDDGPDDAPMCLWPQVAAVEGAAECLAALHGTAPLCVATDAAASDRAMVERALERVDLLRYVSEVFCFTELGFRKNQPEFWQHVRQRLGVPLDRIAMLGDSLENDVLVPRRLGVQAVWLDPTGQGSELPTPVPTVNDLGGFAELVVYAGSVVEAQP